MFKDAALPRHFLTSAMLASAMLCALPVTASAQSAPAPAPVAAPVAPAAAPAAAPQIRLEVLTPGTGAHPADEDVVLVNYEGRLVDGTVFDANPRAPLPVNRLIPGFTQGLKQMQKGGRYRLTIPAALGYADNATGSIPPNSDLIFTVELLDFAPPSGVRAMMGMPSITLDTHQPGVGRMAQDGDVVLINYRGALASGQQFDAGEGIAMIVGQMIPGFNEGLQQMQAGGRYTLTIPATLGYGDRAVGPIPANSDLRFDVDLIAVRSMEEIASMMRAAPVPVGPSVTPPATARPRR